MKLLSILFLLITFNSSAAIDYTTYYDALHSDSEEKVRVQIAYLKKETTLAVDSKNAYLGAMLMKKAQFLKTPKEKIKMFKKGKELLESAIQNTPYSVAFKFLRLIIQENCPKFLKYNSNIEADVVVIKKRYNLMSRMNKYHVIQYAKTSQALNLP